MTADQVPICNQAYCVYYGGFNTRCTKKQDEKGDPCPLTVSDRLAALKLADGKRFSEAWRFAELLYVHGKTAKVRDKAWDWMQANREEYGKTHDPAKIGGA